MVGKVGTGKSSLLAAITAEMRKVSGQVEQYLFCCYEYNKMHQNVQNSMYVCITKYMWFLLCIDIC